ncbi:hypothetical protein KY366_04780 [Candidatus Woesearchaeota archaeon]|nr:hypothetical protein [Candidatus Woesearchaeota archaeon]
MADDEKKAKRSELRKRWSNNVKNFLNKKGLGKWHEVDVEASPPVELELKDEDLLIEFRSKMVLLEDVEGMWNAFINAREQLMELYEKVGFLRYAEITMEESLSAKRGTRIATKKVGIEKKKSFEEDFQKSKERKRLLESKIEILKKTEKNPKKLEEKKKELEKELEGFKEEEGIKKLDDAKYPYEIPELNDKKYYYSEWFPFKADVNGKDIEEYYPSPLNIPFRFRSSLLNDRDFLADEFLQAYFGFQNVIDKWTPAYEKFFEDVIEQVRAKAEVPEEKKDVWNGNLNTLKDLYTQAIKKAFLEHVHYRENKMFGWAKEMSNKVTVIENMMSEFTKRVPKSLKITVYYRHTYLIVDPKRIVWPVFGKKESNNPYDMLKQRYGKEYGGDMIRIKEYINKKEKDPDKTGEEETFEEYIERSGKPFEKKDGEKIAGLDENGWPLEVADKGYEWPPGSGKIWQEGTVLKDIFNLEDKPRVVPMQLVEPMEVSLASNCIHNEWDAVRDDLRDGRYHADSLTIVDYLMADGESRFEDLSPERKKEWEGISEKDLKNDENKREKFRRYKMYYLNENRDPDLLEEGKRRPSNLVPAFDKRAIGKPFIHLGRKYYYQTAGSILELEDKDLDENIIKARVEAWGGNPSKAKTAKDATGPFISTRGISQYIITKVLHRMKYFDEANKIIKGIMKNEGVWFDYGPRKMGEKGKNPLGPW